MRRCGYHQRPHERTSRLGNKFIAGRERLEAVEKEWGFTENVYDAGYILQDGRMIDMSQGGALVASRITGTSTDTRPVAW